MIVDAELFSPALLLTLPLWLYAEIHYRFKGVPSRLFMKEPEIIADIPHRLEPDSPLPILLIVKDAKRFPIRLHRVTAGISDAEGRRHHALLFEQPLSLHDYYWWQLKEIALPARLAGQLQVNVVFEYEVLSGKHRAAGRVKRAVNDNYRGVSHAPLMTYAAAEPLPVLPGYLSGDVHYHSDGTDDQVEFGAPLHATAVMARAMGLQFFAVTDHSYDIDDLPGDYLANDPQLQRWHAQRREIAEWNAQRAGVTILPGEEVTCANRRGRNVHFLILGHPHFLPGSGDSAERWFRTGAELSVEQVLSRLDSDAAAFAAHLGVRTPLLEWLLLRRGRWYPEDTNHGRLDGLQIWNGHTHGAAEGLLAWREMLLAGRKVTVAAGNDAHGNFGRFRQVSFPFLRMREHCLNLFGRARTVVRCPANGDSDQIIAALRKGNSCISTGPVIQLRVINRSDESFAMGETVRGTVAAVNVMAVSSHEFGELENLRIWYGDVARRREELFFAKSDFAGATTFTATLPAAEPSGAAASSGPAYFRAELATKAQAMALPDVRLRPQALSNPVWIEPGEK